MSKETDNKKFVSFTFNELVKDVNYDRIFLFVLSYEYNLNLNQVMTLFNFSSDIFWTYINTFRHMLKLGDRKATMLKHSARKVYFKWLGSEVELTEKETEYYNFLMTFINDSFTNGSICLHMTNIAVFPVKAYGYFVEYKTGKRLNDVLITGTEELIHYMDSINYIDFKGEQFFKTSRVEYLLEKYYGDLNPREIKRKTLLEVKEMINKEAIIQYSQDLEDKYNALLQHRQELVNRSGR